MNIVKERRFACIKSTAAFFIAWVLLSPPSSARAETPSNSCTTCHADIWEDMKSSVHSQHAITCEKCHGGDPTQADEALAHSAAAGYIGVPEKQQIAQACGSCHADVEAMNFYGLPTDQLARYKTSVHGKKLFNENDTHVAVCSDCHGYHDVLPISDPQSTVYPSNVPKTCAHCHASAKIMDRYGLPTDIYKTYQDSVHGKALLEKKDLSAPNCASCHGSHGAMPPGVKDVANTCGKCHMNEKKYFLESVHAKAQEEGKFNECVSCHGNHGVEPVNKGLFEKACAKCHEPGTPGMKLGGELEHLMGDSEDKWAAAQAQVKQASIEGLFVEEETASLEEIKTNVIAMKPLQHTLSVARLSELHKKIEDASDKIQRQIDDKRKSLKRHKTALIPIWIFILVMMAALWAKYKQLKSGKK